MKTYQTSKLYLGGAVYIVSTTDKNNNILVSTMSSSYSLGNILVMGMSKAGNTAKHIQIGDSIALNYLFDYQQALSNIAGYSSGNENVNKSKELNIEFAFHHNTPYIRESMIAIIAKVDNIVEDENYLHFFLKVDKRLVNEKILSDEEKIVHAELKPLIYLGDELKRVYKKTDEINTK